MICISLVLSTQYVCQLQVMGSKFCFKEGNGILHFTPVRFWEEIKFLEVAGTPFEIQIICMLCVYFVSSKKNTMQGLERMGIL